MRLSGVSKTFTQGGLATLTHVLLHHLPIFRDAKCQMKLPRPFRGVVMEISEVFFGSFGRLRSTSAPLDVVADPLNSQTNLGNTLSNALIPRPSGTVVFSAMLNLG